MIDKILIFLRLFLYLQDVRKTEKNTHAYCRSRHTDGAVREHTSDAGYNWRLHAGAHHRYHRADGVCHSVDDALHVFSAVECRRLGALRILFVCLLPPLMYTFLLELLCDGQTVGKRLMKIRTVCADGSQPTMGALFLRWLMEIVDIDMVCLGVIPIIVTRRHQRLGDFAAGTMVIRTGDKVRLHVSLGEFAYASPDYKPVYPGTANLTLRQAELIECVVSKSVSLTYIGNDAYRLADKVAKAIHVNATGSPVAFLRTVLFDYQHYALQVV